MDIFLFMPPPAQYEPIVPDEFRSRRYYHMYLYVRIVLLYVDKVVLLLYVDKVVKVVLTVLRRLPCRGWCLFLFLFIRDSERS